MRFSSRSCRHWSHSAPRAFAAALAFRLPCNPMEPNLGPGLPSPTYRDNLGAFDTNLNEAVSANSSLQSLLSLQHPPYPPNHFHLLCRHSHSLKPLSSKLAHDTGPATCSLSPRSLYYLGRSRGGLTVTLHLFATQAPLPISHRILPSLPTALKHYAHTPQSLTNLLRHPFPTED